MKTFMSMSCIYLLLCVSTVAQNREDNKIMLRKSNHCIGIEQPGLNVLYKGIENPIHIVYSGNCKLALKINNGTIIEQHDGNYSVFVNEGSTAEISIFEQRGRELKNIGNKKYRIKSVPNPIPSFAGKRNGEEISKALLLKGTLAVNLDNFLYDVRYEVISFSVSVSFCGEFKTASTRGSYFNIEQLLLMNKLKYQQKVVIEDIKVKEVGSNGGVRTLPAIKLRVIG